MLSLSMRGMHVQHVDIKKKAGSYIAYYKNVMREITTFYVSYMVNAYVFIKIKHL